jgi:hypothetical protein
MFFYPHFESFVDVEKWLDLLAAGGVFEFPASPRSAS